MPIDIKLDPGLMVGATGLLIALINVMLGMRRERFENTLRVIQWLQEPVMLQTRNRVGDIMAAAKSHGYDFYKLSPEDRAALSGVANLFGLAALLAQKRTIDRRLLLEGWSRHIIATYDRLEPYFAWRMSMPGGDSLRSHFEWLAKTAAKRARARKQGPTALAAQTASR